MQNTWSQINYNKFTCISEPLKYSSSIGDSVRTLGFASFGAGYRVFADGDTTFGIGNNINIDNNANNAFAIGKNITLNFLARNAFAFGNNIGIGANMAFGIGNFIKSNYNNTITIGLGSVNNVLMNNLAGSLMLSMNSTAPSIFVGSGYDAGVGKVGIGTIAPGSQLQINGNCAIGFNNSTIAPDNGLLVNGNVGIGTNSLPTEKLEVNGGIRLQTMVPGSSENGTILWNGNDLLYRKNSNWHSISYYGPWDTTATTATTDKNIGIGTSTLPTEKLEVNGGIRLQTMIPGNSENGTILWNGTDLLYRKNSNWQSFSYSSPWDTNFTSVTTNKNVGIGVDKAGEKLEVNGAINLHAKEPLLAADGTIIWSGVDFLGRKNGIWVSLTSTGTTSSEWISTSNGIYTNSKRVGINTMPAATLHIKSFYNTTEIVPASIRLETTVSGSSRSIKTDLKTTTNGEFVITHQNKEIFTINNTIARLSNQLLIFRNDDTDPDIFIASQGETNHPCIRLENTYNSGGGGTIPDTIVTNSYNIALTEGVLKIQKNTLTTAVDIISFWGGYINIPSQTNTFMEGNVGVGAPPTSQVKLKVGGNASFLENIGIGTNTPTSRLHIKGNNTDITLENINNTPPNESSKVIISAANGAGRIISDKDFAIFIDSNHDQTNEGFYIMDNSNCWDSTVVNLMQVNSIGTTINNKITVGNNANTVIMGYDGAHNYIESNNSDLLINYYNQKNVTICKDLSVSGNVNIGNNVKIYNDGKVWASTKIVVANSVPGGWGDFVFNKDYKLMSLNELEQYIITEKHLPNIPSAKEIDTDGIDLGNMNNLLLQKVEQLTLYIIEQNKKIENLEKDMQTLKDNSYEK